MGADANHWLGLILAATGDATSPEAMSFTERRGLAEQAVSALEGALEVGALSPQDVVPRLANFISVLATYGRPEDFHPSLAADQLVRRCLALAGMSPDEAAATEWALREEDVPVMRRLRRVRNAMTPAVRMVDLVEDEELRERLEEWRDVLPRLP